MASSSDQQPKGPGFLPGGIDLSKVAINKKHPESELVDVLGGSLRWESPVLDQGLVALVDCMPRLVPKGFSADQAIVQAARVSYGIGTKKVSEDRGLIRYLVRHRHTTPLEMCEFKFHVVAPIFVARQWLRHRTASVNEYSARYSVVPDRFYRPSVESGGVRLQSQSNRQGGEQEADSMTAESFLTYLDGLEKNCYENYEKFLGRGVSREQARILLPVSIYTEFYFKIDLHNLFHFLSLRLDLHAQKEIRDYAIAMFALIQPIVPDACEAFVDYRLGAVVLTRLEVDALRSGSSSIDSSNKREQQEWEEKRKLLGIDRSSIEESSVLEPIIAEGLDVADSSNSVPVAPIQNGNA